ncbi:hypothetical protein SISSUDRAFT_1061049 [Sistotremastrum suecicum HHB10207 ss-3]|uniref:Uncharacterized protein n=1 Tax=Sistotremastrum suecicum HHB10207 ss-3 TaxID=1314776 RepID=A0A166EGJ7_9AGAM|nr:hypothetical protein SISSUDRAFT_1061049 [Sistotremastrum suecicum HHB10207 ss-3]
MVAVETPVQQRPILTICFTLLIIAQVGMSILLLTIILANIRRAAAFYNFLVITWIGVPIYLLLLYTGEYRKESVRQDVCALQAVLKHGLDSAFSSALFMLALESWRLIAYGTSQSSSGSGKLLTGSLLSIPWVHFVAYSTTTALLYDAHPENVHRNTNSFYCTLHNDVLGIVQATEVILTVLATFFFERKKIKKAAANMNIAKDLDLSTFVRLIAITLWQTIGILSNAKSFSQKLLHMEALTYLSYAILASVPLMVFLVFSSQKDIILTWYYWKSLDPTAMI